MVFGIHYTPLGLKIIAKEIKRSLYSRQVAHSKPTYVHSNARHSLPGTASSFNAQPAASGLNTIKGAWGKPSGDARQEIQSFLKMAMTRLGNM